MSFLSRAMTLTVVMAVSPLFAGEAEFTVFEIRNDFAYAEGKIPSERNAKPVRIYKPGIPLPSDKKTKTQLFLGNSSVAVIEKDYFLIHIPAELKGQISKGDILRLEMPETQPPKAPDSEVKHQNYIFGSLQLLQGLDQKFRLAGLGYERNLEGAFAFGNLKPEMMSLELRPLQVIATNTDTTSLSMFYKFSFIAAEILIFNAGLQVGLDKNGSVGGGLAGIGFLLRKVLRFEVNIDWLYNSYMDSHGKLSLFLSNNLTLLAQSGVLSLNAKELVAETLYYPTTTFTTRYADRYTHLSYFTLGLGFMASDRVRLTFRAGVAGTKLDNVGLIGRGEIGFLF